MRRFLILPVLLLSACAVSDNAPDTSYGGQTYNQLVSKFGQPDHVYTMQDMKLVEFKRRETIGNRERTCTGRFWLHNETVQKSTYDGDDDICRNLQRGGRNTMAGSSNGNPQPILQPADGPYPADPPINENVPKPWGDIPSY